MKHATTLVCIILLVLFLNNGTNPLQEILGAPQPITEENQTMPELSDAAIEHRMLRQSMSRYEGQSEQAGLVSNPTLPLMGRVICIDPGHQADVDWVKVPVAPGETFLMPDYNIGTVGVESGVYEYGIALKVARKLENELKAMGANVVLTRESDDQAVGNIKRAEIANKSNADAFVSLHCDGIEDPSIHGVSVLHPGGKYIDNKMLLQESRKLSEEVLKCTVASTDAKNRGLMERNSLIVFNYSQVPCTLIEMGFLTCPDEDRRLNSEEYQNKLAKGIAQGILNYFNESEIANNQEEAEVEE